MTAQANQSNRRNRVSTLVRTFCQLVVFAFCLAAATGQPAPIRCHVCDAPISGRYFLMEDRTAGDNKNLCLECGRLETRCFVCGLPVKNPAQKLKDGRLLCERDAQAAIFSALEVQSLVEQTRLELNGIFNGLLTFSRENLSVSIADQVELARLFKSPGFGSACGSVFGVTRTRAGPGLKFAHSIFILSGLSPARIKAVAAHELAHTWLAENIRPERQLSDDAVEGFCEFVAYKLMDQLGAAQERKLIEQNTYTRGQIELFIEAEKQSGLGGLLSWLQHGTDNQLDQENMQRVQMVRQPGTPTGGAQAAWNNYRPPVRSELVLQGLSGSAKNRMALINDCAFRPLDKKAVRLGETNITVQCLEIRKESVIIKVGDSPAKRELFLKPAAR